MKKQINIFKYLIVSLLITLQLSSCDLFISPIIDENEHVDQLFRPISFSASVNTNKVDFSWVPIDNANFKIKIYKSDTTIVSDTIEYIVQDDAKLHVENLWSETKYTASIIALSKDSTIKNSEKTLTTFTTGTENIFYEMVTEDITENSILVKWDKTRQVSHIIVSRINNINISLSDEDVAAGQKLIPNLNSKSKYSVKIYYNEMLRGSLVVTTK